MESVKDLLDLELNDKLVDFLKENFSHVKPQNFFATLSFMLGQFAHNHCSDQQAAIRLALLSMIEGHAYEHALFEKEFS